ncbi:MAG: PAS domain S-box protein [Kamptonema sp. SIO1D9]|nr:PAS domain S-box protein [Kamptonema sp. SIO1D9]
MTNGQQNFLSSLPLKILLVTANGELISKIGQLLAVISEPRCELTIVGTLRATLANLRQTGKSVTVCLLDCQLDLEWLPTIVEQNNLVPVIYLCENQTNGREALARGATDYLEKEQLRVKELERSLRLTSKLAQIQVQTQQLQASEAQFRQLAENIEAVFWLATPDFQQILYISPQYEQIWQYSCESLSKNPSTWLESIHPEDRQWMSEVVREVIEGKIPKGRDKVYRIVRRDGEIRWRRDRLFFLRTETGDIYRLGGISEDITSRKEAELKLSKRERYLTALVEIQRRLLACSDLTNCYQQILQPLGEAANADRVYIFENHFDRQNRLLTSQKAEWCAEEIPPEINNPRLQNLPDNQFFPRWQEALLQGNFISGIVAELPQEERDFLEPQRILSILILPLFVNDRFFGSIGFDNCSEASEWEASEVALLQIAAAAVALKIERLLAEEELSRQERQFRTLTENSPEVIARFDRDLRYVYVNPTVEQATGIPHQSFIGRTNTELGMPANLVSLWSASLQKVFATGIEESLEFDFPTPEGLKTYQSHLVAEYAPDNSVEFVLVMSQNITPQKLTLEALRESEERFRVIFEQAAVGIAQTSPTGQFLQVNQRFCNLFGYTEAEILNFTWQQITYPEDLAENIELARRMFAGEIATFSLEKRYLRKDGSLFWANITVSLVSSESGLPKYTIAVIQDITERKQAEFQLRQSESQLRLVTDALPVCISYIDANLCYQFVNQTYEVWFGINRAKIYGRPIWEIIGKEAFARVREQIEQVLTGELVSYETELPYTTGKRYIIGSLIPDFDENEQVRGYYALITDISDRRQVEEKLRYRLNLETALAQVSRELATNDAVDFGQILGILGKGVGSDRAFIDRFRNEGRFVDAIYEWCNEGVASEIESYQNLPTSTFPWWIEQLKANQAIVINDLRNLPAKATAEQRLLAANNIGSLLAVPIFTSEGELWGSISFDNNTENRKTWSDEDVQMLQIVGDLIYTYQEKQRSRLEQERASRDRQLLAALTLKIRRSLSIDQILETTVTELQVTLAAERVVFFRLLDDGSGEIVNEAIEVAFPAMLGEIIFDENLSEFLGKYRNGFIYTCADLLATEPPECYREWLEKYQIRANLVVPILMKSKQVPSEYSEQLENPPQLWGLLCVQQCSQPRKWTSWEIELVTQFANQLGIALSQAQLLEQKTCYSQELARSNAELEQFAYVASHDLQEPLQTISSYVKLLEKRYSNLLDAKAKKYLYYITSGSSRMQALINDLLAYSRLGRNTKALQLTDCNLIIEQAKSNLRQIIRQNQATIINELLPTLIADRSQLIQLFQNLISNAIKYRSEAPPVIQISATLEEDGWCFAVRDNGIGINPKYRDRIFQIFQRLHTQEEYPGTGIGLAICQKIVESHGGRIWVDSSVEGGSVFYFTLPNRGEN